MQFICSLWTLSVQLKRFETLLLLVPVLLALVVGCLQMAAWSDRIGWDTVSYLDLAEAYRNGRLDLALSPYWSPLYPLLFAGWSALFSGVPERMSLGFFQYACFLLFGLSSAYLWKTALNAHRHVSLEEGVEAIPLFPFCFFAVSVSVYSGLVVGSLGIKSPDMLAAALFVLANGMIVSLIYKRPAIWWLLLTGMVMGLAYLTKAFFISWIIPCLVLLFWQRKHYHLDGSRFLALAGAALLTVACYAVPLSLKLGYPSIGETGKYQFIFCQTETTSPMVPLVHGTQTVSDRVIEQPKHPSRLFFDSPRVYEFAEPFDVSYPPWFNPHYWNEGFKVKFDWQTYLAMMPEKIMTVVFNIGILAAFMMLYLGALNRSLFPFSISRTKRCSAIVVPSKLCILLLLVSVIWPRYLIGFLPLLFAGLLLTCRYPNTLEGTKGVSRMLNATSILMLSVFVLSSLFHLYFAVPQIEPALSKAMGTQLPKKPFVPDPHSATAAKLAELGIKPKDRVARISSNQDGEYYWTRLANIRVVCESVDAENFFKASSESRNELYKKLQDFGIKAIVFDWSCRKPNPGAMPSEDGWIQVPDTNNYVRLLR
ncbi:MAG: hypothetical protein SGJ27_07705 [Candidatus Melainabacteria bacterium]|nr:hypothetical protein [Candidatus Melainabacteria bacterium]